MMYVVLTDLFSLETNPNGMRHKVLSRREFLCEGFSYREFELEAEEDKLYLVQKYVDENRYDSYITFVPIGMTPGSREEMPWLFGEDTKYLASIFSGGNEYAGIHSIPCEVKSDDIRPGFVTEYETNVESVDNPKVFVFEEIDPRDEDSYILLLQGVRVSNSEVEFLGEW